MTDEMGADEPLTVGALEEALETQRELVGEVRKLRTSNRWLAAIVGILLVLMAVTGVFGGIALNASHEARKAAQVASAAAALAQEQADANKATLAALLASRMALCDSTNDARAKTVSVWETFMNIAAPTPTPEQQVTIDRLLGFVHQTYQPLDCSTLATLAP